VLIDPVFVVAISSPPETTAAVSAPPFESEISSASSPACWKKPRSFA
jgi:hypothetical protein